MADKDYGPHLTRYLNPSETGFDTVVYQAGKPLLDSEFVLDQEIQNSERATLLRQTTPSGWLTGDFGQDENHDFDFRGEADTFHLVNKPIVNVNGWVVPLEYTGTTTAGENQILLGEPAITAGGAFFADFVYLEVWRVVIGPDPSEDHKPAADKIYRHGNVLSPSATWLDDDLIGDDASIDPQFQIDVESTRRVQIQYRIRHQRIFEETTRSATGAYADTNVYGQGAASALTSFKYGEVAGDPGLWRAGDGDPANSLDTVDGYVYSIPLAIVYRRNQDGFDFRSNGNGSSLIASGSTLHPDGIYADEIIFDDVVDLRNQVSLTGFESAAHLDRNVSLLMAQKLRSSGMYTQGAGWRVGDSSFVSNLVLKADDLVPSGNDPYASQPGFSGNIFGSADGIRKTFTDAAHHEAYVVTYETGVDWATPSVTLNLDLTNVGGTDLTLEQPDGTVILDIISVTLDDASGGTSPIELPILSASGLGTTAAELELDTTGISSSRDIWVEYEIMYPAGSGLNAHVTEETGAYSLTAHVPSEYDTVVGAVFTDDDAGRAALRSYLFSSFEGANRSATLTHTTEDPATLSVYSTDTTTIILPEALYEDAGGTTSGVVSVSIGATNYTVDGASTEGRTIILSDPLPSASEEVEIEYYPLRPLPPVDSTITVFYKTSAHQAISLDLLDTELDVQPVLISDHLYVGTGSSGSNTVGFPHEAGLQQIPVHIDADYNGEHELDSPGPITITGFDALTSSLKLPTLVPLAVPDSFVFEGPDESSTEQEERMGHYTSVDLSGYKPTAMATSLSGSVNHKCFLPMIVKTAEDTDYARAGELLMVILSNYIRFSSENVVAFTEDNNTTCAAIYRLKGKPLTHEG